MQILLALLYLAAPEPDAGRQAYLAVCARCHGEDGADTGYANVKRLDGIGTRLSRGQIRDRLRPVPLARNQFLVRAAVLNRRTLDALVAFVAGLPAYHESMSRHVTPGLYVTRTARYEVRPDGTIWIVGGTELPEGAPRRQVEELPPDAVMTHAAAGGPTDAGTTPPGKREER